MLVSFCVYAALARKKYFEDILKTCKGLAFFSDPETGNLTITYKGTRTDFHTDCAQFIALAFEKKFRPVNYVTDDDHRMKWFEKDLMGFYENRANEDVFFGAIRKATMASKETGQPAALPSYEKARAVKPYAKCVADIVSGKSYSIIGAEYSKDELAKARELIAAYGINKAA